MGRVCPAECRVDVRHPDRSRARRARASHSCGVRRDRPGGPVPHEPLRRHGAPVHLRRAARDVFRGGSRRDANVREAGVEAADRDGDRVREFRPVRPAVLRARRMAVAGLPHRRGYLRDAGGGRPAHDGVPRVVVRADFALAITHASDDRSRGGCYSDGRVPRRRRESELPRNHGDPRDVRRHALYSARAGP